LHISVVRRLPGSDPAVPSGGPGPSGGPLARPAAPGAVWRSRVSGDADNGISKQDIESRRERERATSRQPLASVRSSSL